MTIPLVNMELVMHLTVSGFIVSARRLEWVLRS